MREIAFGASFACFAAIALIGIAAWPVPGLPVAAFFREGHGSIVALQAVAAADGVILAQMAGGSATISLGDRPGYASSLYAAGAWLVVDARFARLCLKFAPGART